VGDDYLNYAHLVSEFGEDTAAHLGRFNGLTGLDGFPCVERERVIDLLGLLENENERGGERPQPLPPPTASLRPREASPNCT
jgi:hypothetical protein